MKGATARGGGPRFREAGSAWWSVPARQSGARPWCAAGPSGGLGGEVSTPTAAETASVVSQHVRDRSTLDAGLSSCVLSHGQRHAVGAAAPAYCDAAPAVTKTTNATARTRHAARSGWNRLHTIGFKMGVGVVRGNADVAGGEPTE